MGRRALTTRRLLLGAVATVASTACSSGDDDDTLAPLPIEGATTASESPVEPLITGGDPVSAATTPGGLPIPSAVAPGGVTTTAVTADAPAADWDGARFDAGTIDSVSTIGAYTAIDLDRWSFIGPDGNTLAADEFDAEPLAAWWTVSPFTNENVRTRTFVLASAVEVLVLDGADQRRACAQPPPADPPTRWTASSLSAVGPTPEGTIAVLTYSPTGQVTRLRLTRGC